MYDITSAQARGETNVPDNLSRDHLTVEHVIFSGIRYVVIYRHYAYHSKALCGANATGFPQSLAPLKLAAFFFYKLFINYDCWFLSA